MFKLFNTLWHSAARQAQKVQRKQTRKLLQQLAKPKPVKPKRPVPAIPAMKRSAHWKPTRFTALQIDPSAGLSPGKQMDYWLYLPEAMASGGQPTPLVVMLHGCAQTAAEFAEGTRMNKLGESKGFGVLYPQQTTNLNPHRCWHWYKKTVQDGKGEAALIAEIINHVVVRHGFDATRVYLAGLSAGAGMAHIVALHHPQLIAAVGLHSGPMFGAAHNGVSAYAVMQNGGKMIGKNAQDVATAASLTSATDMPAILIHGLQDSVVRPINLAALESQFCALNGLTPAQRQPCVHRPGGSSRRAAHPFDTVDYRRGRQTVLRICQIFQLQHAWSGGNPAYPFNDRKGPDASRLMWNFFMRHRREPAQRA
jgi:poly(hydroxyalkanoate) depolymerase family esterase